MASMPIDLPQHRMRLASHWARACAITGILAFLLGCVNTARAQNSASELSGPNLIIPNQSDDPNPAGPDPVFEIPYGTLQPSRSDDQTDVPLSDIPRSNIPGTALQPRPARDYWVISSRKCPQHQLVDRFEECFEFFHQGDTPGLKRAGPADFYGSLQPGVPICFVIHGSYMTFSQAVVESAGAYRWLRSAAPALPVHFVFFTWPSDQDLTYVIPVDMLALGLRASFNGVYLGRVISQIPASNPISFVGHSHGSRVTAATLHLFGGGEVDGYTLPASGQGHRRFRAVLAAGAIDHHWLNPGQRYGQALPQTESLLNLRNSADIALGFYPLRYPFTAAALGRSGFSQHDIWYLGAQNGKLNELDVAPILGNAHNWPNYYREPTLAAALVPYVYFTDGSGLTSNSTVSREAASSLMANSAPTRIDESTRSHLPPAQATTQRLSWESYPGINLNVDILPRR